MKHLWFAAPLLILLLTAGFGRLLKVGGDEGSTLVWLWAWQTARVDFVNSVTGRPVSLSFRAPWRLAGFEARSDPGTEEYYTAGEYSWSRRLDQESARELRYCSEVGITLSLGGRVFHIQGGCVGVSLQWPP